MSIGQIAIVDDDTSVRRLMERLIRSMHYAVESFGSAEAFLEAGSERFNCLILDLNMQGMGGIELLEYLTAQGNALPTVIVTARPQPEIVEKARLLGVMSTLAKPFGLGELEGMVREAVDG